ncbi:hypothetical protein Pph01_37310 [Planotetraspora phitsanulokensis]|uniref:Uncharacterized protein n=1 Tax=Planotetraspora phitsanulokensis TaxID=575192 RepID=A0A8J3U504_9ACTN|nr:hypothetical protein Pph01_37310 [Planotetraspora phitsanulokensis]
MCYGVVNGWTRPMSAQLDKGNRTTSGAVSPTASMPMPYIGALRRGRATACALGAPKFTRAAFAAHSYAARRIRRFRSLWRNYEQALIG